MVQVSVQRYKGRLSAQKWMNFWKISKGGGGVVSDPKNIGAIFFALQTALLVINFRTNFEIGGDIIRLFN